jgi:glutamate N-acetyltransferase / amino-acid N-acetyltransferase
MNGGELTCAGFRFAGACGGIKKKGGLDLGVIAADEAASCAAVFTQNRVKAAPVRVSQAALKAARGRIRGIVVNSGNANACTGPRGDADARRMARLAAAAIDGPAGSVLVASTGVIGEALPMDRVEAAIRSAGLSLYEEGFAAFAEAIMTTDRRPKIAHRTIRIGRRPVSLLGCTKGAGMIAPNMATTLTFIVTDAGIAPGDLDRAVRRAVEPTYNAIAVDGDTSTNDMLAALASGAGAPVAGATDLARFTEGLTALCDDLAHQLMADGEGVHHVVAIEVTGAASDAAARAVARRVATSPLVKTAIAGADPNWGRILCAVGNAGVAIRPDRIDLALDEITLVRGGVAAPDLDDKRASAVMHRPAYAIRIELHQGKARTRFLACDLSHDYVSINADYRT